MGQLKIPIFSSNWLSLILLFNIAVTTNVLSQDKPKCESTEIEKGCSEGKYLNINGISLYYEVRGSGEPLLLLHYGAGSAENFNPLHPNLTSHFQVITPDSRAQGRSSDSEEPLSYRLMVDDMITLMDSLGIDSAYVGGASDGAAIAIHMAIHHPERVRALILGAVDLSSDALTDVFWEEVKQYDIPEKLATLWYETRISPTKEQLAEIDAPTLLLIGEEEQYIKFEHIAWQANSIPNATEVWIPEADHFVFTTHPNKVSSAILSFLNKN